MCYFVNSIVDTVIVPTFKSEYHEMTVIIASCLAVNLTASLIFYKLQSVMRLLEGRLESKVDNLDKTIRDFKGG